MTELTREAIEKYLMANGHPQPESDGTLDEFMNGGERQGMYDEAVRNNYALSDVDRWFHLVKVMGVDMKFETALKIDRALYEEDLETMELNLPEERFGLDPYGRGVFQGPFEEVKEQVKAEVIQKDGFHVGNLADIQVPGLKLSDAFKLYAELRGETDGAKTVFLMGPDKMFDLSKAEDVRLEDYELRDIIKDFIVLDDRDPLDRYIEQEVAFRLEFVHSLHDVSEDVCSLVTDLVKNNRDVMFDYESLDRFLEEQYAVVSHVDQELLKNINSEIARLADDISPDDFYEDYIPDEQKQLDKLVAIKNCMLEAGKLGVTLHLDPERVTDLGHLDPFWFGEDRDEEIGYMDYEGYRIGIEVHGDVAMSVLDENMRGEILSYRSQDGKGTFNNKDLMSVIPNDDMLHFLEGEGRLNWSLNNWFECFVFDEEGIEIGHLNQVLDGNLLDAFGQVGAIVKMIDAFERGKEVTKEDGEHNRKFIFDDELMINDDFESINGYLWAVDYLVDKLTAAEDKENINFYADYDVRNGGLTVTATYDTFADGQEVHRVIDVPITMEERVGIISEMEKYCQNRYGRTLNEFVEDIRFGGEFAKGIGPDLKKEKPSDLDDRIQEAALKGASQRGEEKRGASQRGENVLSEKVADFVR